MTRPADRRRGRLVVQPLEDRTVPAFTLTIDGDVANNVNIAVDTITEPGTTIFSPTATGAVLDVDAIEAALNTGNVLVTTGSGGTQAGSINYIAGSPADELTYFGFTPRTLTLQPDASATVGNITVFGAQLNLFGNVDLTFETTATSSNGAIDLTGTTVSLAQNLNVNAGTGRVDASGTLSAASGDVTVAAGTFVPGGFPGATLISDQGAVNLDATTTLATGTLTLRANSGTVNLNQPVDGPGDLRVYGTTVAVNAALGEIFPITTLTFAGGAVSFGTNTISADTLKVGDGIAEPVEADFGDGTGTVAANLFVLPDGNLAPGGVGNSGTLTLVGNLTFDGGDYSLDLEPPDLVAVTGNVTINAGRLGDERSTGAVGGTGEVSVIELTDPLTNTLTGTFDNAPLGSGFYLASDPHRVTAYGPDAVRVARIASAPKGVATGFEPDGTQYTFRLTGGGELVTFKDLTAPPNQQLNVYVRNTSFASKVTLTTKANGSDTLIDLGPVRVAGPLGAFAAAPAILTAPFQADQAVRALTFGRVDQPVTLGGTTSDKTTLKADSIGSTVTTPGVLSAVTVTGGLTGTLSASSIGTVKVGGQLTGTGPSWTIPNGVKAITAARIESFNLTTTYLGTLSATGSKLLSGDVSNSTFRLTANDATAGRFGLKTLTAKGNVRNTQFDVEEGNVGTVKVGRFIDSQLFVDYTPIGAFNTGGSFDSSTHFKIGTFTTTALPLGDSSSALNFAFAGSQVAADTLGTVRLSGLETSNSGNAFGFKFATTGGSVRTKEADSGAIVPNVNMNPTDGPHPAQAGDFYYMDV